MGLQEDNSPVHTNTGVRHWLLILPGAISEAELLCVVFYCQLGRVGTQGALAQTGRVKISDPLPKLVAVLGMEHQVLCLAGEPRLVVLSTGGSRVRSSFLGSPSGGWAGAALVPQQEV